MSKWRVDEKPGGFEFLFESSGFQTFGSHFRAYLSREAAQDMAREVLRSVNKRRISDLEAELAKLKAETP